MKTVMINMEEMTDSKEVYGQRPNPFISVFIYCLVALLAAAFVYACFGKIDIVATASGIVRPNDDVSTVSSLVSGQVTGVFYADGQLVHVGDKLLTVDTSDTQIVVNNLERTREKYETQAAMLEKYLDGVEAGSNPFSDDPDGEEYVYYTQFRDFLLSLQNTEQNIEYDASQNSANIDSLGEQIANLSYQISGLTSYRNSIEHGRNLAENYPEYSNMYQLYEQSLEELQNSYDTQRRQIESGDSAASNQYYLQYYQDKLADYTLLLDSIRAGDSQFPAGSATEGKLLYDDYGSTLAGYEQSYQSARNQYEYYRNGGNTQSYETLLAYEKTMLEGYRYFLDSVEHDTDMFSAASDSIYYRSLYTDYKAQYDRLTEAVADAEATYNALLPSGEDGGALSEAEAAVSVARTQRDSYKAETIASINNTILQIQASIAEKELSLGLPSQDYNLAEAQTAMDRAEAAIETYKNSKALEYQQTISELNVKITELTLADSSSRETEEQLSDLDDSYENAAAQKKTQAISQIDSSLQSLQSQMISARSNLRLYELAANLYENNVDENGQPISISLATMEQISSVLNNLDTVNAQLSECETQLEQAREQLRQGTVSAEKEGVINVVSTVVTGDILSAGTPLATIIPPNESEYKVQIYVSSGDIGSVKVGDEIKYNIAALPSSQYGVITGTVRSISQDVLTQNGEYSGYYLIEGNIENKELTDRDGNTGVITIGMQLEAKIVTQRKTIMRYLLEKINLA